jgi:hypothetical protein
MRFALAFTAKHAFFRRASGCAPRTSKPQKLSIGQLTKWDEWDEWVRAGLATTIGLQDCHVSRVGFAVAQTYLEQGVTQEESARL